MSDLQKFSKELEYAKKRVGALRDDWKNGGPISAVFGFFNGRCTFFAILFSTVGITLAFKGKLTMEFTVLVTVIQALLVAHSVKEDMADIKRSETVVVNNTTVVTSEKKVQEPTA